ncbi:acetoin dehydrogenase-like protein [Podospora conica]|nr:acetoin dehydrogenase-like protein [Schizothecium conicum]
MALLRQVRPRLAPFFRPLALCNHPRFVSNTQQGRSRTAIVTGAGRGIGRAIAIHLARDGYDVTVNDLPSDQSLIDSTVSAIQALGRRAHGHAANVVSSSAVNELVESSVAALGPLNTMVANAGIFTAQHMVDLEPEDFEQVLRVNVLGVHNCFRAAAKEMIQSGTKGKLIAASSVAATKPWSQTGHYCASKAAVRSLTSGWALEMGPYGITANAYAPGGVDTRMVEAMAKTWPGGSVTKEEVLAATGKMVALGRVARPEDIARVVSFLASQRADFVTGQTVVVDGGMVYS